MKCAVLEVDSLPLITSDLQFLNQLWCERYCLTIKPRRHKLSLSNAMCLYVHGTFRQNFFDESIDEENLL